ncbi:MAG: hypothetical protein HYY60_02285 [Parcubacteria group bacterium]|nr:hypothetical protein [Parcubacteria group bacterium]
MFYDYVMKPDDYLRENFNYRDPETVNRELARLSLWKKFLFWWRLQVSVGRRQPEGFLKPMEFFLFFCKECGPVLAYPQGYERQIDCEDCRTEEMDTLPQTMSVLGLSRDVNRRD